MSLFVKTRSGGARFKTSKETARDRAKAQKASTKRALTNTRKAMKEASKLMAVASVLRSNKHSKKK